MSTSQELTQTAQALTQGDKAAVAQALNLVEDQRPEAQADILALFEALGSHPKLGHRVGLTGPPGVGKSSLAAALSKELRKHKRSVGVLAVDPSSVHSGGSLLGDRVRMSPDPSDQDLFVRSLATAGQVGGLAQAANSAVHVLSAAYDVVLVETTGVGQSETDIVHIADTVVLVIQPGSGDVLQFLKAGIMEIPDILVVNKSDHGNVAEQAVSDLRSALRTVRSSGLSTPDQNWEPPILATSASKGSGIAELIEAFDQHRAALGDGLNARREKGELHWTLDAFTQRHGSHGVEVLGGHKALSERCLEKLQKGTNPISLTHSLSEQYLNAQRQA